MIQDLEINLNDYETLRVKEKQEEIKPSIVNFYRIEKEKI